jgi:hypothetical protein
MPKPVQHAPPNSTLGLLQRGRGEGYRRVVALPKSEAWGLLVECICNDPRLDSQAESRAEYYAEIALKVELDVGPIGDYLREYDDTDESGWNTQLAVYTLDELARRGHLAAAEMLLDYVRWGARWEQPFYNSGAVRSDTFIKRLAEAFESRFPTDDELKEAIDCFFLDEEPWRSILRHSPRIAKFQINARKRSELKRRKDFSYLHSLSVSQLLEQEITLANGHEFRKAIEKIVVPADVELLLSHVSVAKPAVAGVALAGLAKLAPPSIFDWVTKFWSDNAGLVGPILPRLLDTVIAMPSDFSLPLAREWLFHDRPHERRLAEQILQRHATPDDIPSLRFAIAEALKEDYDNVYRICNLVEAFRHLPDAGVIPELCDVFAQFRYSFGRMLTAKAMAVTAPAYFDEHFAFECLWDCEPGTRQLAAERVSLGNHSTRCRPEKLAGDELEEDSNRPPS